MAWFGFIDKGYEGVSCVARLVLFLVGSGLKLSTLFSSAFWGKFSYRAVVASQSPEPT